MVIILTSMTFAFYDTEKGKVSHTTIRHAFHNKKDALEWECALNDRKVDAIDHLETFYNPRNVPIASGDLWLTDLTHDVIDIT